ncbi:hypothetical protein R1flu_012859 [Riccia fluitans]|uniref:Uncharacterized protein n=1 Tax=Riccia fluitans TaxID=41844 RepID=A0ABD1ZFW4_9MARC
MAPQANDGTQEVGLAGDHERVGNDGTSTRVGTDNMWNKNTKQNFDTYTGERTNDQNAETRKHRRASERKLTRPHEQAATLAPGRNMNGRDRIITASSVQAGISIREIVEAKLAEGEPTQPSRAKAGPNIITWILGNGSEAGAYIRELHTCE